MPSVTISGWMRSVTTSRPFSAPMAVLPASARMTATAMRSGRHSRKFAKNTVVELTSVPSERSMPPVRITMVCPRLTTPSTAICCARLEKLRTDRKRSEMMPPVTRRITMRAITIR